MNDILDRLFKLFDSAATSAVNLFGAAANVLIANPLILTIALFLGLTAGKSLKLGNIFSYSAKK